MLHRSRPRRSGRPGRAFAREDGTDVAHRPTAQEQATVGEVVRSRRWEELGYLQADVAHAIGVSPALLSELERGTARFTEFSLWKLAHLLDLDYIRLRERAAHEG